MPPFNKKYRIMKIWKYILSAAALLAMGACNHDADEMVIPTRDVAIASHSALIVNDINAAEEFTLVWSAAKFGFQTEVEYTVAVAIDGGAAVTLGTTSNLYYTTTNAALLEALNISLGGDFAAVFTVTATAATGETSSDSIELALTNDKTGYLYVVADGASNAIAQLVQFEKGMLRGFVQTAAAANVKLYVNNDLTGTAYGVKGGALSAEADATAIALTAGLHYVQVNLNALTVVDVELTDIGLIGEAVGGWDDASEATAMFTFDAATGVWTAVVENVVKDKEYKVRFNKMWNVVDAAGNEYNISLGGALNNLEMGGGNLVAKYDGKTTFTLDLSKYPYTMTEAGPAPTELYIIGGYQGWNHDAAHSTLKGENGVLKGFLYMPDTADAAQGFKFCSQHNWDGPNFGQKDGVINTDGDAGNLSLEPGLWFIEFDYYANTLTTTAITGVGLIGDGDVFGGWGTDVDMTYDATTQTWSATIENVAADNEYKVRFNDDWAINLGGDVTNLTPNGSNLKTVKSGTVTFELNIFAHPYTIIEK